jgi:hypothetical protein
MHTMKRFITTHANIIFLLVLCCVGFVLRWPAVWFGLPYTPHPDEPYVINMVLKMLAQGSLFPGSFDRPHLSVYPVWLAVWLQALRDPIPAELLLRTTDRITQVVMPFVVGRMTSIVMALVAIPLVAYHVRQKNLGRWAWFAAAWVCVLPFHVAQSAYIGPDGLVAVMTLATLIVSWHYTKQPSMYLWWAVALTVGFAIGTKYNLAAIIIVPAATQWDLLRTRQWRALITALAVLAAGTTVGFFATTPGLLVNAQQFVADMNFQVSHYSRQDPGNSPWDWQLYLAFFWGEGWPFVATPLTLLGLALIVRRGTPLERAFVVFLAIELVFFLSRERHYMRNIMPLVIYAPIAMAVAGAWLTQRYQLFKPLPVVLVALLLIPSAIQSVQAHRVAERPYNRVVVDALVGTMVRGAIPVCTLDVTSAAQTPSCAAASNKTDELSRWQQAGMQTLLVNRSQWPDYRVPDGYARAQSLPNTDNGGNGDALDLYSTDPLVALQVIGTPAQTSDGLRIEGVRIGIGPERDRITPLYADTRLQPRTDAQQLHVNTYLTVTAPVTEPGWWIFVHIIDAQGAIVAQRISLPRDDLPIATWQPDDLVVLRADVPLAAPLPPGAYTLSFGFFRPADGARMVIDGGLDGAWQVGIDLRQ